MARSAPRLAGIDALASKVGEVQEATLVRAVADPSAYTYELKWDGYRIVALKSGDAVRLVSREGQDVTRDLGVVARDVARLAARECAIDGEACALDERGVPSFQLLQNRGPRRAPIVFFAFDLLWLDGEDLRGLPIEERRARLERVVGARDREGAIVISTASDGDPRAILRLACERGLEGIVAKRRGSTYRGGRSPAWLTLNCKLRGEPVPAAETAVSPKRASARGPRGGGERVDVCGVSISHPSRVLDPTGLTKLELARYYEAIGPWMLPHVAGRPLTLVRWAEGRATEKGGVYLRHAKAWGPDVLRRVRIREKTKLGEYLVADTIAALVGLAQMDVLEIHTWNSRASDVERPDRIVFDLDPAPDVPFAEVASAAVLVRDRLAAMGLASFAKTTGGKGLHVVVPLEPDAGWDACFAFSRAFARLLEREAPARFVSAVPKHARRGKILVDYLRNNRGNTSVAAFSTRAREGAPVSVPIGWDEVGARLGPQDFTPSATVARLRRRKSDAWSGYEDARQRLPAIDRER